MEGSHTVYNCTTVDSGPITGSLQTQLTAVLRQVDPANIFQGRDRSGHTVHRCTVYQDLPLLRPSKGPYVPKNQLVLDYLPQKYGEVTKGREGGGAKNGPPLCRTGPGPVRTG